ncbi:MAG: holo-ACP synthase [Bacteroidales bacterium]|nr:holo-ACP synthase [Bacteroidales bacterium]MCF8456296.1 holo-ACP synthase [Bacteroidales bacterium]
MIVGIGTDMIEVERIEKRLSRESGLKPSLFTQTEIDYCESKKYPYQHFAARFSAKEAFFKALGTGWRYGMKYTEIEIQNDKLGKPYVTCFGKVSDELKKRNITGVHVSISHLKEMANAMIVLESN